MRLEPERPEWFVDVSSDHAVDVSEFVPRSVNLSEIVGRRLLDILSSLNNPTSLLNEQGKCEAKGDVFSGLDGAGAGEQKMSPNSKKDQVAPFLFHVCIMKFISYLKCSNQLLIIHALNNEQSWKE
jgi:hypothetical protein